MMKLTRRITCLLLVLLLAMSLAALPASAAVVKSGDEKGLDGGSIHWEIDDKGTLTVSGDDRIPHYCTTEYLYDYDPPPWWDGIDSGSTVKWAVINPGVKGMGQYAFGYMGALRTVSIPTSVSSIFLYAFTDSSNLTTIYYAGTRDQWNAIDGYHLQVHNSIKDLVLPDGAKVYFQCDLTGDPKSISYSGDTPTVAFPKSTAYTDGQFRDVNSGHWFAPPVASACQYGLMKGTGNGAFSPNGNVTLAETITMAARINSIVLYGSESFKQSGGAWYQTYLDYAYNKGIIGDNYYKANVNAPATRSQFAEILYNAMPRDGLLEINTIMNNMIPDVKNCDSCAPWVYALYRAGILTGDSGHAFHPDSSITRAEAAAIISRMACSQNRVSLTLITNEAQKVTGHRYEYVVSDESWGDARLSAMSWTQNKQYGHLVWVETREEYEGLKADIERLGLTGVQFRVGGYRTSRDYHWDPYKYYQSAPDEILNSPDYWLSSEWGDGEPSFQWKDNVEDVLEFYYDPAAGRWVWNDIAYEVYSPGQNKYGYIIEIEP